jgi:hypothetical protein
MFRTVFLQSLIVTFVVVAKLQITFGIEDLLGRATKVDVSTIAPRNYFFENFYIFNFIISDRKCSD